MLRIIAILLLIIAPYAAHAEPAPSFDDPTFSCSPVPLKRLRDPVFVPGTRAANFPTRIKQGMDAGINFCGKYTLVSIGMTGPYEINFLVDRRTGRIYDAPTSSIGTESRKNSSLLILNGEIEDYAKEAGVMPKWLWREFYVRKGSGFELIRQDRGPTGGAGIPLDTYDEDY